MPLRGSDSHEAAGEWSAVVDQMRGRLIAVTGRDTHGATEVKIYLELQNLDAQPDFGKKFSFNRDLSVVWKLSDFRGKPVPDWTGSVPWLFLDYASMSSWISVPGDSTLRFPIGSAGFHVFQPSGASVLSLSLMNTPPWQLAADDREQYYISATFKGLVKGESPSQFIWSSTLSLPPVRLPDNPIPQVWSSNEPFNASRVKP